MIISTFSGPNGMNGSARSCGLGGLGLTQGVDFNCNATICYGIGDKRHQQFQLLQQLLNMFAGPLGFAPLTIDGFLGTNSANVANVVTNAIVDNSLPGSSDPAVVQMSASFSNNELAHLADGLIPILSTAASAMQAQRISQGLPPTPSSPLPSPSAAAAAAVAALPPGSMSVVAPASTGAKITAAFRKNSTWYMVAGAAAAVAVAGGIGYAVYRHKEHPRRRAHAR
jgi:hypothetical protein